MHIAEADRTRRTFPATATSLAASQTVAQVAGAVTTGRSADGLVTIVVGGRGDVRAVRVDPGRWNSSR